MASITLDHIEQAARSIAGNIIQTPLIHAPGLSRRFDAQIYLKLENLQKTGSFKVRGATFKLHQLTQSGQLREKGVVAASAGNHAQGVALAARSAGVPATIVMPQWATISKQEATRRHGGRIIIHGSNLEESIAHACRLAEEGLTLVHPFDDPDIITGQGTTGLEIMTALPDVDTVIVPIGGGGLISGISLAVKALRPATRVIGVETAACPSAQTSLRAGRCVQVEADTSIADGISVKQLGQLPFQVIKDHVDEVVLVQEAQIAAAILTPLERKKTLAEGAGATPLAALAAGAVKLRKGEKVVLVVSGGNVDSPLLGRIINQGLVDNSRIMRIRVRIDDKPGALLRLLTRVAALEANVLHIHHDRSVDKMPIYETSVDLELETRSRDHIQEVLDTIAKAGYAIEPVVCT